MASEQSKRGTTDNKVEVEKDRVPKMATHFESLAEKESGEAEKPKDTPEEISNLRGTAQQNSIEAIRAAEERYQKAKEETALKHAFKVAAEKVVDATKTVVDATSSAAGYTKDKVAGAGETVGEKLAAAKDVVVAKEEKPADYAGREKTEAQKSPRQEEGGVSSGDEERQSDEVEEYFEEGEGEQSGGGSVFEAIGETIVEIGKTAKDLLVGQ